MDEYGQVGPEKPDYDDDVVAVAKKLGRIGVADVEFTHRMTRHHVVLVILPMEIERHNGDEPVYYGGRPAGFADQPGIFVAIDGGRAGWLPATGDLYPSYVDDYLGTPYGVGETALTNFVNSVATYLYGAWRQAAAAAAKA